MGLKLNTASGGSVSIEPTNTASNYTLTVPAQTGTVATLTTPSFASTIGVGGATAASSGAGITFPATQSASTDANTLDDYEEGTFTPTVIGFTTTGTATYSSATGKYTKVGNIVYFTFYVIWTGGTGAGGLGFGGLPFTAAGSGYYYTVSVGQLDSVSFTGIPTAYVNPGQNTIVMQNFTSNSTAANINYDSAGNCLLSGCYIAA